MTVLLGLASSVLWGTSDFLGGLVSRRRPALVAVAWSAVIGLLLISVAVLLLGSWHGPFGWLPWGVAAGSAGGVGLACYYSALASGTMGVVAPIASLGVMVPVVAGFLRGENPSMWQGFGILVAIVGIVLTSGPELSGGAAARPVVLAVVSGLMFGLFFVAMDAGAEINTVMTLWAMRASVVSFFILVALVRRTAGGVSIPDLGMLAAISLGDLLANLTFGLASTRGYISIASVLSSLYPVVTVLLARIVLHERLQTVQVAGVAVTVGGVGFISAG